MQLLPSPLQLFVYRDPFTVSVFVLSYITYYPLWLSLVSVPATLAVPASADLDTPPGYLLRAPAHVHVLLCILWLWSPGKNSHIFMPIEK